MLYDAENFDFADVFADFEPEAQAPLKKKRKSSRPPVLIPRLLLGDIRRSYMSMFVNTLNTHDFASFYGFLHKYCSRNVCYHQEGTLHSMRNIELTGVPMIAQLFYNRMVAMPDLFQSLPGPSSIICHPSRSQVVSDMHIEATLLFDADCEYFTPTSHPINTHGGIQVVNRDSKRHIGTLDDTFGSRLLQIAMLKAPVHLSFTMKFLLHLNATKEIERMEFLMAK